MHNSYECGAQAPSIPYAFLKRRIHSLTGFFIVLFLFEHLLTNSQAALFIGDDGAGFIRAVNWLQSLPYLPVIEIVLLGLPIAVHSIWGIASLCTSKPNSFNTDGSTPALPQYSRNKAYTWQRITSLLLLIGIAWHVIDMRFLRYPSEHDKQYSVQITNDPGLTSLADRLGVTLQVMNDHDVIATAGSFGTATLLNVRDTFKSISNCLLYTFLVVATCFHAMNGLWTMTITWGIALTERSRLLIRRVCNGLMFLLLFLGLAAIWGTYWINLKS